MSETPEEENDDLIQRLVDQVRRLLDCNTVTLWMVADEALNLRAISGVQPNAVIRPMSYRSGEGLTGWVQQQGQSVRIANIQDMTKDVERIRKLFPKAAWLKNFSYDEAEAPRENVGAMLFAPIKHGDRVSGVLRCAQRADSGRPFSDDDLKTVEIFAETAAAAIEARNELRLLTRAPFVFVLMPFAPDFQDIYELGIREAVVSEGMRCERVDEMEFNDSILEQIYKSIQMADIIVADMTGRNANVFYEVGYAHALHKDVILLTQDSADIPFDLKHHNHIVYGKSIRDLKIKLRARLLAHKTKKQG